MKTRLALKNLRFAPCANIAQTAVSQAIDLTSGQPVPRLQLMCFMNQSYGQTYYCDDQGEFRLRLVPGTQIEIQSNTRNVDYVADAIATVL